MKHITYADKAVFVEDETADCLVEYAALMGSEQTADTVTLKVIGQDGNQVEASFVLNGATNLMAESTNTVLQAPRNEEAVAYMREKMDLLRNPPYAQPDDAPQEIDLDEIA